VVNLTARAAPGHVFPGWSFGTCAGTGTCAVTMTANRTLAARFLKGPFRFAVRGSGSGSGRIRSQPGLSPAIDCVVTNGVASATGCAASYPVGTVLRFQPTAKAGSVFSGWSSPCRGTGSCVDTVAGTSAVTASFRPGGLSLAATEGRWGEVIATPIVAVHLHLLPTGKVMLWGDRGEAQLWDPAEPAAGFVTVAKPYPLFCSGHTFLADGSLLVAGGSIGGPSGEARGAVYHPATGAWSATDPMAQGRYYPTLTTLADGDVLVVSGNDAQRHTVTIPEVGRGSSWRRLTTAPLAIDTPFYPDMFLAPNGLAFMAGFPAASAYLDPTGTGHWIAVSPRQVADRRMGSAVMYAPGKILYAGGGDPPTTSAEAIDLNLAAPAWQPVAPMHFPRRQMNATILADGQILVTHGSAGPGFNDVSRPVREAELWDPATGRWTVMAPEAAGRTYHSTALLLPDGRVLTSGSGEGAGISFEASPRSAQVFTPPYLFASDGALAHRPPITSSPPTLAYRQTLTVHSTDAGQVHRGSLIRLSSVTHAFNQSQLLYPLRFTATDPTTLQAAGPASGRVAPPGPYLLFLINDRGVPSRGRIVTVGP
jgi:hypothetical protein